MTMVVTDRKTGNILQKYEKSFGNNIALLASAKKGLSPQAVFDFISLSAISFPMAEKVLNKTLKTFTSYKEKNTSLDAVVSEKLLKLFSLYHKGLITFGDNEEFNKWLTEPAFGLGNQVPVDLLDTITGIDLIAEELTRIQYGDLA